MTAQAALPVHGGPIGPALAVPPALPLSQKQVGISYFLLPRVLKGNTHTPTGEEGKSKSAADTNSVSMFARKTPSLLACLHGQKERDSRKAQGICSPFLLAYLAATLGEVSSVSQQHPPGRSSVLREYMETAPMGAIYLVPAHSAHPPLPP